MLDGTIVVCEASAIADGISDAGFLTVRHTLAVHQLDEPAWVRARMAHVVLSVVCCCERSRLGTHTTQ
jgi:hypothetical protein